jgi:hypothetical protein
VFAALRPQVRQTAKPEQSGRKSARGTCAIAETELLSQSVTCCIEAAPDYRASCARIGKSSRQVSNAVDAPARLRQRGTFKGPLRYRYLPLREPPMRQTDDRALEVVLPEIAPGDCEA